MQHAFHNCDSVDVILSYNLKLLAVFEKVDEGVCYY